jgi:hypothetical protein
MIAEFCLLETLRPFAGYKIRTRRACKARTLLYLLYTTKRTRWEGQRMKRQIYELQNRRSIPKRKSAIADSPIFNGCGG